MKKLQKEAKKISNEIFKKGGSELFFKIGASSLHRLLVDKGLVSEREILEYFITESKERLNK